MSQQPESEEHHSHADADAQAATCAKLACSCTQNNAGGRMTLPPLVCSHCLAGDMRQGLKLATAARNEKQQMQQLWEVA